MIKKIKNEAGFIIKETIEELDDGIVNEALIKFDDMKNKGVILDGDFESSIWIMFDEKKKYKLDFSRNKDSIVHIMNDKCLSVDELINKLKVFVVLRLGTTSLVVLKEFVGFTLDEIMNSNYLMDCKIKPTMGGISNISYYIEFVRLIEPSNMEYIKKCEEVLATSKALNAKAKKEKKHPCTLNEFQSYFKFDESLRSWWSTCDEKQKKYYYPLYLFWIITTILPLRVTEFCVTPYECIRKDETNRCFLTIRRTRLKGQNPENLKIHYYTIEDDYKKSEYEIPEWLYEEIKQYREMTNEYKNEFSLLLNLEYALLNRMSDERMKFKPVIFDAACLNVMIGDFYKEVIVKSYDLVDETTLMSRYLDKEFGSYEMKDYEMMKVLPKHTRHIAMINLILRGCNPVMIKEFAGHSSNTTSSNYYANMSNVVRCKTKMIHDKLKKSDNEVVINEINPLSLIIDESSPYIQMDKGRCYSNNFVNGIVSDCSYCGGNCMNCRYFIPEKKDNVKNEDTSPLDEELRYLYKMLASEDIEDKLIEYQVRMQQLETQLTNYSERLFRSYVRGEMLDED